MLEVISWTLLGLAVGFHAAYGMLKWILGMRREALYEWEKAVSVLLHLLIVHLVLWVASEISTALGLSMYVSNPSSAAESLKRAAGVFWNASRVAVDTVMFVSVERAVLAAAPLTTPLSSVLGGATGWSTTELSIVSIFFMHLSFASDAISRVSWLLLSLGATLTAIPSLRKAGATLLAAYLSSTLSLVYSSNVVAHTLERVRVPSGTSIMDWIKVAEIAGNNAVALGSAATHTALAIALGAAAGVGLTSLFGSVYISLTRV
uniref:Uncharacterized protein n=1 Tax=Thermofilum pendens TaxID=2269 RepID=A0A7C4BC96_THEPE